jgi:hypothetical protein
VFSLKWKIYFDVNPLSFYKILNSHPERFLAQVKPEYLASCSTFLHLGVAMWIECGGMYGGRTRLLKMGGQKKIKSYLGILTNIII